MRIVDGLYRSGFTAENAVIWGPQKRQTLT